MVHKIDIPYIISEAGVNHNGSLSAALRMVDIARFAGANCIKFQAYSAEDIVTREAKKAEYQEPGKDESQYEMLLKYEMSEDDFREIFGYCREKGIDFLATPFSPRWVKILVDIGVHAFKISSGNVRSKSLLKEIGMTGLPAILSTGMSTATEIENAIITLKDSGCEDVSLLHCVSLYPTPFDRVNLFSISFLREKFKLRVGFSDHTKGIKAGPLAVAAGATILEKHFTVSKSLEGPDHKCSLEPHDLKKYIENSREAFLFCGSRTKILSDEELKVREVAQDSLVAKRDILKGEGITNEMLVEKRPAGGISPMDIDKIIGKVSNRNIKEDETIQYEYLS